MVVDPVSLPATLRVRWENSWSIAGHPANIQYIHVLTVFTPMGKLFSLSTHLHICGQWKEIRAMRGNSGKQE